jgi:hypothetical protein
VSVRYGVWTLKNLPVPGVAAADRQAGGLGSNPGAS